MTLDQGRNVVPETTPVSPPTDMFQLGVLVSFLVIAVRWMANWLVTNAQSEDKEKELLMRALLEERSEVTAHLMKMNEMLISRIKES